MSEAGQDGLVTAAILVIGDEILSGRTKDKNIGYIAEYLTAIGVDLRHQQRIDLDADDQIVERNEYRGIGRGGPANKERGPDKSPVIGRQHGQVPSKNADRILPCELSRRFLDQRFRSPKKATTSSSSRVRFMGGRLRQTRLP